MKELKKIGIDFAGDFTVDFVNASLEALLTRAEDKKIVDIRITHMVSVVGENLYKVDLTYEEI